jgi:type I restriction enzyme M protein
MIWSIKELIRDDYNDKNVDQVILPFTLLRRLDCVMEGNKDAVDGVLQQLPPTLSDEVRQQHLTNILKSRGILFYNTSGLSLKAMVGNPAAIGDNFKTYLEGYSSNVKDILYNFTGGEENGLSPIYATLERKNLLFMVVQEFVLKADLHPDKVDNHTMGTVFETIIRYSKESTNEAAGQYYTPREIVRLLVRLVMTGQEELIYKEGQHFSIYDPCCGTGGMLTVAKDYLKSLTDRQMDVNLYGQELNEQTYAICKSDLLMKGDNSDNIRRGNTLTEDHYTGKTFNFMITNPPFGVDWKKSEDYIRHEAEDANGRFAAGLPSTSDGSLLFLQHMIHKMHPEGARIGIVLNGSPLFNGDAGSGWSNIRKMLLDRDLLDAIVALPKNLFYGTDIASYLWILDNRKPASHRGKVLLINGVQDDYAMLRQRSLGKKRYDVSDHGADRIVALYAAFASARETMQNGETVEVAKLMDADDFRYTKVTVERPLRLRYKNGEDEFTALQTYAAADGLKLTAANIKKLRTKYAEVCEDGEAVFADPMHKKGGYEPDPNLRDSELIPAKEDIEAYFRREVLKFVPDAWMDRTKDKEGVEFPFTKLFYVYKPLRPLDDIIADLKALDKEAEADLDALSRED